MPEPIIPEQLWRIIKLKMPAVVSVREGGECSRRRNQKKEIIGTSVKDEKQGRQNCNDNEGNCVVTIIFFSFFFSPNVNVAKVTGSEGGINGSAGEILPLWRNATKERE